MKKLILLLFIPLVSFSQSSKGFIACGLQTITHIGGDMSKASYSEIVDISNSPALVAYIDNTSAISIMFEIPETDPLSFQDVPLIKSYRNQNNTYYLYQSDNSPSLTLRIKNEKIVELIVSFNKDRSFSLVNNCDDNVIINYYRNNPEKFQGLNKL